VSSAPPVGPPAETLARRYSASPRPGPGRRGGRVSHRPVGGLRPAWRNLAWTAPALVLLGVFVYFPLLDNFWFSFTKLNVYTGAQTFVGTANYSHMAKDPVFWTALGNNVWYAVISVVLQVFASLVLAAMVESIRKERLRKLVRAVYFIPSAISLTVAGLLFYFIYQPQTGVLDAFLHALHLGGGNTAILGHDSTAIFGVIAMSQWQGFGYSTLLFAVALQRIPKELYEAAAIDGVGPFRRFFTISMPLVREMTGVMVIATVSGAFQVFNEVTVMTGGGPANSSQVLGTWLFHAAFTDNDFGYAAAIATAVFVITLALALLQLWISRRRRVEW
jgi:raffinose/stachyose/melibiose transport system permease protein